jgi:hypothetical protein
LAASRARASVHAYVPDLPPHKRASQMKVNIDNPDVEMVLGNNGVTFSVCQNDETYLGKLRVGKGTVEWCRGKTRFGNGVIVNWTNFIKYFEGEAFATPPISPEKEHFVPYLSQMYDVPFFL